jgi:hypothetical protein
MVAGDSVVVVPANALGIAKPAATMKSATINDPIVRGLVPIPTSVRPEPVIAVHHGFLA